MESDRAHHFLFKYGLLIFGVLFLITSLVSAISPGQHFEFNGERLDDDLVTSTIFGLIGLILILLFVVVKDKFVRVALGNQAVKIYQHGQERFVNWLEVESVKQIQFVTPPLYTMKIKDTDDTVWFNTKSSFWSFNGYTTDMSDMGALIKKKKRELGL